jgi:hypothetical protein
MPGQTRTAPRQAPPLPTVRYTPHRVADHPVERSGTTLALGAKTFRRRDTALASGITRLSANVVPIPALRILADIVSRYDSIARSAVMYTSRFCAGRLDIPKSSAHRYMGRLMEAGLLEKCEPRALSKFEQWHPDYRPEYKLFRDRKATCYRPTKDGMREAKMYTDIQTFLEQNAERAETRARGACVALARRSSRRRSIEDTLAEWEAGEGVRDD